MMSEAGLNILLVEDNPGDVRLAEEMLKTLGTRCRLSIVEDGVEAMAFVRQEGRYADAPRPHLILLDLKLPKKDGLEVLVEIKSDEALKRIPVVVMTASSSERDIRTAYHAMANSYVIKPGAVDRLREAYRAVEEFWLTTVNLPQA